MQLANVTLAKPERIASLLQEADLKDYALYESLNTIKGMIAYRPVS